LSAFAGLELLVQDDFVDAFEQDANLDKLARSFKVSREAMGWRLVNLGLLS
jgi:Zn-dependent peptidase ImmA (M78 family)